MRVRFAATNPTTGGDCPAGGDWNAWCQCMFSGSKTTDPNLAKCQAPMLFAPWTELGAAARGIPHFGTKVLPEGIIPGIPPGGGSSNLTQDTQMDPGGEGIFGLPTTIAVIGGGVVVAGALMFFALSKRRRAA